MDTQREAAGTTAGSVHLQIQQLITRVWGESYCVRGHINHLSSTNKCQHAQRANPTVFYLINSVNGVRRARFSWEVVDVMTDLARQLHRSDCRTESCPFCKGRTQSIFNLFHFFRDIRLLYRNKLRLNKDTNENRTRRTTRGCNDGL